MDYSTVEGVFVQDPTDKMGVSHCFDFILEYEKSVSEKMRCKMWIDVGLLDFYDNKFNPKMAVVTHKTKLPAAYGR